MTTATPHPGTETRIRDIISEALFNHWQRDVKTAAQMSWPDITPHLRGVFDDQATAAWDAVTTWADDVLEEED